MPNPILDTGIDEAIARGIGLGLQARQLRDAQLYRDDILENRARALDIAEQNAATRAEATDAANRLHDERLRFDMDRADAIAADRTRGLDLREAAMYQKENDADRKRAGLMAAGQSVYEDLYPPEENIRGDMGPFPSGEETTPEYRAAGENFATMYPDLDPAQRVSEWKSAHEAVQQRQALAQLQAHEAHPRESWPGGPEDWDARHRVLWMKAYGAKGSPTSYFGSIAKPPPGQEAVDAMGRMLGPDAAAIYADGGKVVRPPIAPANQKVPEDIDLSVAKDRFGKAAAALREAMFVNEPEALAAAKAEYNVWDKAYAEAAEAKKQRMPQGPRPPTIQAPSGSASPVAGAAPSSPAAPPPAVPTPPAADPYAALMQSHPRIDGETDEAWARRLARIKKGTP